MAEAAQNPIRCRPIEDPDIPGSIACLMRGFPERTRDYWEKGLAELARRPCVGDRSRYGHLLECDGAVVGVLLEIISTSADETGAPRLRCNLSSWCVDPPYRHHAILLHKRAAGHPDTTYVNISPAPHTHKTIEALGFRRYSAGQVFFAPLLSRGARSARIVGFAEDRSEAALLTPEARRLLADHAAFGCRALIGVRDGAATPIVLQWRTVWRSLVPGAHVLYCPSERELAAFSRALGFYCARHGRLFMVVDAAGPIAGLAGKFFPGREPRYFKGPRKPAPSDLAYTELAILGR